MSSTQTGGEKKALAIALMGPTASGKTALAIALREKLHAEIISVDSALVYRGMDIGTAKPDQQTLSRAPHRLIDIRDPSQPYSVAEFCEDAEREIQDISAQGKTPLLVGGTMLYFKSLMEGLADMPAADEHVRKDIEQEASQHGWRYIHSLLEQVDPLAAAKIHPHHTQRLSRALEVYRVTGQPLSSFHHVGKDGLLHRYRWVQIAMAPRDRCVLHQRIEQRFEQILSRGFLGEVQELIDRGDLSESLPAIRAIGYRQMWQHLRGAYDAREMRERALAATRQLAKRQLTWLRSWSDIHWLYTQNEQGEFLSLEDLTQSSLKIISKTAI